MNINYKVKIQLYEHLLQFMSVNKKSLIENNILNRTKHLTVVLENIFQPHNASAVLRTCDCFGIQDIHIIENSNYYNVNPDVALGSSKWINLIRYNEKENNTKDCLLSLKKKGYRIVATSPHENDYNINDLPIDNKLALVFGTEMQGLSDIALEMADEYVKIPMYGFTESYNISVSAGICLYQLSENLRKSNINWSLTEEETLEYKLNWARNIIKRSELIEEKFFKNLDSINSI
ncbi:TrmH family RNA methyltransferase [Bacteroidota bacterium]